jgi:hypothetical protein
MPAEPAAQQHTKSTELLARCETGDPEARFMAGLAAGIHYSGDID